MSTLLEYETQIFLDCYHEDGLLIMARGMGIERIFINVIKLYLDPENLVIVLNCNKNDQTYFMEMLAYEDISTNAKIIDNETASAKRYSTYLQGGVLFVSTRIFIVDMLTEKIPSSSITGVLFYRAQKMSDKCQEAFALRLFREKNKTGFIKAFSDNPAAFNKGFLNLEKVMKNLFLKNLHLWPRFHSSIISFMEAHMPNVIEIRIKQTQLMHDMQMAIIDLIQLCIKEFKICNPTLSLPEINIENILSTSFHNIIRIKLEPLWDQLNSKTKGLVSSFKILKQLLLNIFRLDSLIFFKQLQFLREQSISGTNISSELQWMLEPSAEILFVKAQSRAGLTKVKSETNLNVYEENPKLRILIQILTNITNKVDPDCENILLFPLLLVIKDEHMYSQVKGYLNTLKKLKQNSSISQEVILLKYILLKDNNRELHIIDDHQKGVITKKENFLCDTNKKMSKENKATSIKTNVKAKALKSTKNGSTLKRSNKKIKRANNESIKGNKFLKVKQPAATDENSNDGQLSPSVSIPNFQEDDSDFKSSEISGPQSKPISEVGNKELFEGSTVVTKIIVPPPVSVEDLTSHLPTLLEKYRPGHVILYDPDITFIRQLEVYQACYPEHQIDIYFLMYSDSVEEQRYLTALKSEKEAFEQLIEQKATMMLPANVEGKDESFESNLEQFIEGESSSRKAGGQTKTFLGALQGDSAPIVLIDVREFRSELPGWLHSLPYYPTDELALSGIGCKVKVLPLTLTLGDYLLTPELCVERKSIPDLIQSLNSGRLYSQVKAMSRAYPKPTLLIEFDSDVRPFMLQARQSAKGVTKSSSSLNTEISLMDIQSKLVLLTRHFPKLRLLWCCDPKMAAELFLELKRGKAEPMAESGKGEELVIESVDDENSNIEDGLIDTQPSTSTISPKGLQHVANSESHGAYDALCKLPGVNSKNCLKLARKAKSLKGLCLMTREEVAKALENSAEANKLYDFIHGNKTKFV